MLAAQLQLVPARVVEARRKLVLHGREVALTEHVEGNLDLLDARVRDADILHVPLVLELGESLDRLRVQARAVGTVQVVQVDSVDSKILFRAHHRGAEVADGTVAAPLLTFGARDAALGRNRDARPVKVRMCLGVGLEGVGHLPFVMANLVPCGRVDVGGVDKGDARLERSGNRGARVLGVLGFLLERERHGSKTKRCHREASNGPQRIGE